VPAVALADATQQSIDAHPGHPAYVTSGS